MAEPTGNTMMQVCPIVNGILLPKIQKFSLDRDSGEAKIELFPMSDDKALLKKIFAEVHVGKINADGLRILLIDDGEIVEKDDLSYAVSEEVYNKALSIFKVVEVEVSGANCSVTDRFNESGSQNTLVLKVKEWEY